MATFKKAVRAKKRLRMALLGPSGSGKTYTALALASGLGPRVAVLDTEHGSASLYAGKFAFDVIELEEFDPRRYTEIIQAAGKEGYDAIVIDSFSHAWSGRGGTLEIVDKIAKRNGGGGNSFTAWLEVTPMHNAMIEACLSSPCHVIATMRTKTEYVVEKDERGRSIPRKVGMAPIQRDGVEYEFDMVADMDLEHNLIVSKTRCDLIDGAVIHRPGSDLSVKLLEWLSSGEDVKDVAPLISGATKSVRPLDELVRAAAEYAGVSGKDIKLVALEELEKVGFECSSKGPSDDLIRAYNDSPKAAQNAIAKAAKKLQAEIKDEEDAEASVVEK